MLWIFRPSISSAGGAVQRERDRIGAVRSRCARAWDAAGGPVDRTTVLERDNWISSKASVWVQGVACSWTSRSGRIRSGFFFDWIVTLSYPILSLAYPIPCYPMLSSSHAILITSYPSLSHPWSMLCYPQPMLSSSSLGPRTLSSTWIRNHSGLAFSMHRDRYILSGHLHHITELVIYITYLSWPFTSHNWDGHLHHIT